MAENKKSGHPTQPGNRSTAPQPDQRKRKRRPIVYRIVRFFKRIYWGRVAVLCLSILGVIYLFTLLTGAISGWNDGPVEAVPPEITEEQPVPAEREAAEVPPVEQTEPPEVPEYIFRDGDGHPVDVQAMTTAWAAEAGMEKRYDLTDAERWEVASVVTAEAAGEPFAGKVAVAQCVLQACEDDGIRPDVALVKYGYAKTRPEPTEEALEAVQAVFDFGHVAATEPIKYFYAPALCRSDWHESQDYVLTINNHRFFKEAKQ